MRMEILRTDRQALAETCRRMLGPGARLLTMAASDECEFGADRFLLRYVFAVERARLAIVETLIPAAEPEFESLTPMFPAASWYEREAWEMFGVRPMGHPDLRPLVLHGDYPPGVHPLRKEVPLRRMEPRHRNEAFKYPQVEGEGVFEIPVGPIHAGVIEPGHFRFQVMGDTVFHLEARLFYTHRGLEKRCETADPGFGARLAEQACGVCSVSHGWSYAQAVERIAGLEVPPRAQFLRTLAAEMERLYNHAGDIGNLCAGVGFAYGSSHMARLKESLMQLNARVTGHRYLRGWVVPGGVSREILHEQLADIVRTVADADERMRSIVDEIRSHSIVMDRFSGTGILNREIAVQFAAVGPAARASGIDMDARRDFPYGAYPQLDFSVPVLDGGDVLARFEIRALEARQSVSLIRQIAERMPGGAIWAELPELPAGGFGIGVTESARGDNVHVVTARPGNRLYRVRIRSASYANWPVVPFSVPGNIVPDFPLINKSFELCYACCDR